MLMVFALVINTFVTFAGPSASDGHFTKAKSLLLARYGLLCHESKVPGLFP